MTLVPMTIKGLMLDPITQAPLIVLRDPRTDAKLPIWVGAFEANAIATEMERIRMPRPSTHDLLRDVIQELGARLTKVIVTDLQDNVFFATLFLETASGPKQIDVAESTVIVAFLELDNFEAVILARLAVLVD